VAPTRRRLYTVMAGATPTVLPATIDGAAVDEDPGQNVPLTFPGMSAASAFALDVLQGFEQQLITSTEAGALLIRDVLVRDYPLIVRLKP